MEEIKIEWYWEVIFFLEKIFKIVYRFIWKTFHRNMYNHPEDIIPKGTIYCYTWNGKMGLANKKIDGKIVDWPYYGTDTCPFHRRFFNLFELCLYCGGDCLDDSCKDCGINEEEFFERIDKEIGKQLENPL